jgi:hypothetical protein
VTSCAAEVACGVPPLMPPIAAAVFSCESGLALVWPSLSSPANTVQATRRSLPLAPPILSKTPSTSGVFFPFESKTLGWAGRSQPLAVVARRHIDSLAHDAPPSPSTCSLYPKLQVWKRRECSEWRWERGSGR